MDPLVSPSELSEMIGGGGGGGAGSVGDALVILDATIPLPGERFDPDQRFREAHLPGARRFDIELFSDPDTTLPHMVPSQGRFARLFAGLGVSERSTVVFYDQGGVVSAARGWWLAGLFGHDRVRVLDGGLPLWRAEGRPVQSGPAQPVPAGSFLPRLRAGRLAGLGDMIALSERALAGGEDAPCLLDARSAGRFDGTAPEPRAGLPGGHVPGAASLPFGELLDGTRMRPVPELRRRLERAGVRPGRTVVSACGSGLTASVLALALDRSGFGSGLLYDGSWTEWAQSGQPRAGAGTS